MNEIQLFNNPEFGEIRTLETTDGNVLFCGKDVANALGYTNPRKALADHCKGVTKCDTLTNGGKQELSFIPESDVYRLAFGSKLPTAEKFTDWVVEEVIPSIRKHGSYTATLADPTKTRRLDIQEMNAKARQAKVMLDFAKLDICTASKELLASNAVYLMTGNRILPEPKVEKTYSATEIGKMFNVSSNMIGRISKANGMKIPEYGDYVLDCAKNGKQVPGFRYNKAGVEAFRKILEGNGDDAE